MKKRYLIILLLVVLFVTGCGNKDDKKVKKSESEIKEILEKEKDFTSGKNVHQEFINVEEFKKSEKPVEWAEKKQTVNIKGKMIEGYVVSYDPYESGDVDAYVLSVEGELYRYHEKNYTKITTQDKVNRIGLYYPRVGGECHPIVYYVLETEKGIFYFDENAEGKVSIKKVEDLVGFRMPVCYGVEDSSFTAILITYNDGTVRFEDKIVKDKITSKDIDAKYVIYAEKDNKERYYVISADDTMYIITNNTQYVEAVAKVSVKVEQAKESEEDVDVTITYGDIVIEMHNLRNN